MKAYSLILVHSEGWQAIGDFLRIKAIVEEIAPDIEVFVVRNDAKNSASRKAASCHPTLVFSPIQLLQFRPLRGKVYMGRAMSKLTEMGRLAEAGLPVPKFEAMTPQTRLSEADYGPFVVLKPSHPFSSFSIGIELQRTEDVRYRPPEDYPGWHRGQSAPMIVQKYIDCGRPMTCRVLTLFGAPLFTYCREAIDRPDLTGKSAPFAIKDFMPAGPTRAYAPHDPDILALAAAAYEALPEIALQACDILRDKDGQLHLLEVNPGGGTWMFSNGKEAGYRERLGVADLQNGFDAFRTCARVLVERTRREAI